MNGVHLNLFLLIFFTLISTASAQVEWLTPLKHDFKQAVEGTQVVHEFKVKNLSKLPLILIGPAEWTKKGECKAEFTQQPILQNQTGVAKLICEFHFMETHGYRNIAIPFSFMHSDGKEIHVDLSLSGTVFDKRYASFKPNACDPKRVCPPIVVRRKICFANPETYASQHKHNINSDCAGHEIHLVKNPEEIRAVLDQVKNSCDVLGEVTISGHADNSSHDIGIDLSNVRSTFEGYNCMAGEDPYINYIGCNSGNSCHGRMMMYIMAKGLFKDKGGVRALATYGSALPFSPHFALDLSARVMQIEDGKDKWKTTGLGLSNNDSLYVSCTNECRKVQHKLDRINRSCNGWLSSSAQDKTLDAIKVCSQLAGDAPAEAIFRMIKSETKFRNYIGKHSDNTAPYDFGNALSSAWAWIEDCPDKGSESSSPSQTKPSKGSSQQ